MIRQTLRLSAGSATQVQSNPEAVLGYDASIGADGWPIDPQHRLSAKLKLHLNDVEWTLFMNGIAILI